MDLQRHGYEYGCLLEEMRMRRSRGYEGKETAALARGNGTESEIVA